MEFAISSTVLLLLVMGLLDLSRAFYYSVSLQGAAREGARHGAWFNTASRQNIYLDDNDVMTAVKDGLHGAGFQDTQIHLITTAGCLTPTDGNAAANKPYPAAAYPAQIGHVNVYICYTAPNGNTYGTIANHPHRLLLLARRPERLAPDEVPADHAVHPGPFRSRPQPRVQRALHDPGQAVKERLSRLKAYFPQRALAGLTEFAIIAPIILLLTFGIIDFGRGLYLYITLQQAANEGARVAVRASYFVDPNGGSHTWPTDSDVAVAISGHAVIMNLANNPACPNGPLPNGGVPQGSPSKPAANTGWIFITDPSTAGNGTPNGPRGGLGTLSRRRTLAPDATT